MWWLWTGLALALDPATTPEQRLAAAEVAVVATVIDQEVLWAPEELGGVETNVWLRVEHTVKGTPGAETLTLALPGGRIGDMRVEVSGVPRLHDDRRYLLLLVPRDDGRFALYGGEDGAVRVDTPSVAPGPSLDAVLGAHGAGR